MQHAVIPDLGIVLAERHGTDDILTLDACHFRAMQTNDGEPFRLLPADR